MSLGELEIQKKVLTIIGNPARIWTCKSGKRLQILSSGQLNVGKGPDFLQMGLLIEGMVVVADGEFHFSNKDWKAHNHHLDTAYDNVLLHICFQDDAYYPQGTELLILDEKEVLAQNTLVENTTSSDEELNEDLQHFALIRLLRKSALAKGYMKGNTLEKALDIAVGEYLSKYFSGKRRPVYNSDKISDLPNKIKNSRLMKLLLDLQSGQSIDASNELFIIIKNRIADEGAHLRREIVLNCILPLAFYLANDKSRIDLFFWYWSVQALNQYGVLSRRFPDISQNYLWQQQGMLEFIREKGIRKSYIKEIDNQYGIAEYLHFLKYGKQEFLSMEN